MHLQKVDRVENISGKDFQNNYYNDKTITNANTTNGKLLKRLLNT
jgi:hypothetical protein